MRAFVVLALVLGLFLTMRVKALSCALSHNFRSFQVPVLSEEHCGALQTSPFSRTKLDIALAQAYLLEDIALSLRALVVALRNTSCPV
jgi:hypothetical protein